VTIPGHLTIYRCESQSTVPDRLGVWRFSRVWGYGTAVDRAGEVAAGAAAAGALQHLPRAMLKHVEHHP
jgi:hypothetical protein